MSNSRVVMMKFLSSGWECRRCLRARCVQHSRSLPDRHLAQQPDNLFLHLLPCCFSKSLMRRSKIRQSERCVRPNSRSIGGGRLGPRNQSAICQMKIEGRGSRQRKPQGSSASSIYMRKLGQTAGQLASLELFSKARAAKIVRCANSPSRFSYG